MAAPLIPYTADGSIPHYSYSSDSDYTWKPAAPFLAVLQIDHVSKGRSAWSVHWKDVNTGAVFIMSGSHFNRLLKEAEWSGPLLIDGMWKPVKRGQNYLIEAILPEDLPRD